MISLIIIIFISLLALQPSFNLALLGDDWLAFFRYFQHLGPRSSGEWNHLTYFLTPYGAQDIAMGLLQKIYGYQSTWYYLTSYFLRMVAALSLYPLVIYLTKSKIGAIFAVIFFAVTVVGFDTTNWSSNMTSYITIALFNLFLYFFLKSREQNPIKLFSLAAILYYLAYVTTPIRMHGSLPFIFLLEGFWVLQERNVKVLKKVFIRFAIIMAVFLIIRYTGSSQGPAVEVTERFNIGVKTMSDMLGTSRFDFLFYPIIMFGSMIIPDFILPSSQIVSKIDLFWSALVPSFLGFLALSALLSKDVPASKFIFFKQTVIGAICWILIVIFIHQTNLTTFVNNRYILLLLIGGFSIILIFFLFIRFFNLKNVSTALFLGLSWSLLSFFFAWWWVPTSIFPTTYRYLIVSAMGISILLATIVSLSKEKKRQISLFIFLSLFIILHIVSTRIYINYLLSNHSQEISNKIWSSIPRIPEIGKSKEPIIFYFEGDGTNEGILHDVITFGFPPHMAILYNLREEDGGFPVPMSDFKEVVSAVSDGKALQAYGYSVKPISPERVYAFHLQGKDNLINITDLLREKINTTKILVEPELHP